MSRLKHALCVGINAYPNAPLSGCVNDANDWADLLADRGYASVVLLDSHATKAAILGALEDMIADARWGDRIVFTYSGHGTWLPDRDGDEPDGRDEALCAYDYEYGGLIRDDEIAEVFSRKRFGVRATIVSDSCHSGTVSRFASPSARPRYVSPFEFLQGEERERAKKAFNTRAITAPRTSKAAVLFSGCQDQEYSYDAWFNGRPNGAFSYYALQVLRSANIPLNYGRWHSVIRSFLPSFDYGQTPELYASAWQRRWSL